MLVSLLSPPVFPALLFPKLKHPGALHSSSFTLHDLILSSGFKQHLYADNFPIYILSPDISPELLSHTSSYLPDVSI